MKPLNNFDKNFLKRKQFSFFLLSLNNVLKKGVPIIKKFLSNKWREEKQKRESKSTSQYLSFKNFHCEIFNLLSMSDFRFRD